MRKDLAEYIASVISADDFDADLNPVLKLNLRC